MITAKQLKDFLQIIPDDWEISLNCEDELVAFKEVWSHTKEKYIKATMTFNLLDS